MAPIANSTHYMVVIEDEKGNSPIFLEPNEISKMNDLKLGKMWKKFHVLRYKTESCCALFVIFFYYKGQT